MRTRKELEKKENKLLAPYAMRNSESIGRMYNEPEDPYRLPFQRDRDRIIHSKAFRRLQAKTQVFVSYYGDHYRDRMTHSIEVSQIARDISRNLGLNEDLSECLSLAHDVGHPPFGHGGEYALDEVMKKFGLGFEHNEQSRRIIEKLEKPYPHFDGLNATKEVLDGLLKHNPHNYKTSIDFEISPHLEAQVMDLSDEIAYTNHDIDDGLRAGFITMKQLSDFSLWKKAEKQAIERHGKTVFLKKDEASQGYIQSVIIKNLISQMIFDLQVTTEKNIKKYHINSIDKVRSSKIHLVSFSKEMQQEMKQLRTFLMENFYHHPKVKSQIDRGKKIIKKLYAYYVAKPKKLPPLFQNLIFSGERPEIVVKDYIAGMTDNFAEKAYDLSKM